jgi:hypothetical protein
MWLLPAGPVARAPTLMTHGTGRACKVPSARLYSLISPLRMDFRRAAGDWADGQRNRSYSAVRGQPRSCPWPE